MSVNSFLNSGKPKIVAAKPATTRVVRRVVVNQLDEQRNVRKITTIPTQTNQNLQTQPNQNLPAPTPKVVKKEPNLKSEEDILTFSIIAKMYLPKEQIERCNLLFSKLLQCKISFQTLSSGIYQCSAKHPAVLKLWDVLINRNVQVDEPLVLKVQEIVHWFLQNNLQPILCIHFFKFLTDAKKNGFSKNRLFSAILNSESSSAYPINSLAEILKFALIVYPLLPGTNNFSTYSKKQCKGYNIGIVDALGFHKRNEKFFIPSRIPDVVSTSKKIIKQPNVSNNSVGNPPNLDGHEGYGITGNTGRINLFVRESNSNSNNPENNAHGPGNPGKHHRQHHPPPKKYTPSHNKNIIPMSNTSTAFLFNFLTKSVQTGQEGGSHNPTYYHVEAPPPTRDLHELLESMEVLEHAIDEIEGFDSDATVYNFVIHSAIKYIYGNYWYEIENCLTNKQIRDYLIDRCHSFLEQISDDLLEAQHFSRGYLETQPTNAFIQDLSPPTMKSPLRIQFNFYETNLSNYIKNLILSYPSDKYKYTSLSWFVRKVLPRFQVNSNEHKVAIFGPKSLACALWYFSLLCRTLEPLFSFDALPSQSYDYVLDNAVESVSMKYSLENEKPLPRKHLTRILKSIITNRTIIDEMADEVVKHFGMLSQNIANFYPIFSRLNRAAMWLRFDPHRKTIWKCADMFGIAKGVNAEQELASKRQLYKKIVTSFPSKEKMYLIKFDIDKEIINVIP